LSNNYYTYIVLPEGYPPEQLEAKFPDMTLKYVGPQAQAALGISIDEFFESGQSYGYFLQPLTDIHLHSDLDFEIEPNGNIIYQAEGAGSSEIYTLWQLRADYDFLETLRLEMAEGRYYQREMSTDSTSTIILNEAAVSALGLTDPIGKTIIALGPVPDQNEYFTLIGIVRNFHFESLHQQIRPMAVRLISRGGGTCASIRIRPENKAEMLSFIEEKGREFAPEQPFEYFFLDEKFESLYRTDQRTGKLLSVFSVLAIFIASLGLFGLASFMSVHRCRESRCCS